MSSVSFYLKVMRRIQFFHLTQNNREYYIWLFISIAILNIIFIPITTIWFKALAVDNQVWNHIYENFYKIQY